MTDTSSINIAISMVQSSVKKTSTILIIVFFLGVIFAPSIKMLFFSQTELWSSIEKRSLALPPSIPYNLRELPHYFSSVDDYLNDHFGYREFFIHRYQKEIGKYFEGTGTNSKVIAGLDDWYFLNEFNLLEDFQGKIPLSRPVLISWLSRQSKREAWLKQRGIKYIFIAAPNKQSIYPDYLMKHAMAIKGTTRFEQLRELTGTDRPDYMVNLHRLLQPEKYDKPLYYKNDTHWNKFAAYLVFIEVFKKISNWFPQESFRTEFEFIQDETGIGGNTGQGGDLTKMIMKYDLTETYPQIKEISHCGTAAYLPYPLSNVTQKDGRPSFIRKCPTKKLRAIVFRDSFFVSLEPFFSENFKEVVYLWKEYDQKNIVELINYFKPDLVIEEITERHIFDSLLKEERLKIHDYQ